MKNILSFSLFIIILFSFSLAVNPQVDAEAKEMVETFFREDELKEEFFTDQVLAQLNISQIEKVRKDFTRGLGEYLGADQVEEHIFNVNFEKGIIEFQLVTDKSDKIAGLRFLSVTEKNGDIEEVVEKFSVLSGDVSLLVQKDGNDLTFLNPEQRLAVGSTFKIAVLQTLKEEIKEGEESWSTVVNLKKSQKSLPSGQLQDWPDNSPLTLQTLASFMISISDNTATDILIDHLGREKIESSTPGEKPFLKTREAFILKNPGNEELQERYRRADRQKKYEILEESKEYSLPSSSVFNKIRALDIEWFYSARELADMMKEIKDLELMSINTGLANERNWSKIAFKGGSEPGVLNYTTWLEDEDGNDYFVTATWNHDEGIDNNKFSRLYQNLIGSLKQNQKEGDN